YLRIGAMKSGSDQNAMREQKEQDRQKKDQNNDKIKSLDFATLLRDPETRAVLLANQDHLSACYRHMPFDNPAYKAMFEWLLRGDGGVYFHCSAGKDRTGLSAMLIMMALGMSEDDMIREYLLSNVYLKDVNDAICQSAGIPEEERECLVPMLGVVEENIRLSLTAIQERYDSYESFMEAEYGIDETVRQKLRRMYCE
ncbi:MAG: tyrosine-protein phosphatase, partial [Lachnospiraceae bacterium]|nr:tyrosine-protein phosphatase [Lachnospiraceae bacterium]